MGQVKWAPSKASSLRAFAAVLAQGAASLSVMLLSVAIARTGGLAGLGEFGLIYSAFMLVRGAAQEVSLTPLLSGNPTMRDFQRYSKQESLVGLVLGGVALIIGLLIGSAMLIILGVSLHGLLLLSYSKVANVTVGRGSVAVYQEIAVLISVLIAVVGTVIGQWSAVLCFSCWALVSACAGYATSFLQGYSLRPAWIASRKNGVVGASFAAQTFVGSGSIHILTMLVGAVAGMSTVGVLRGGSTILGPANLAVTAIRPIVLRGISRALNRGSRGRLMYVGTHAFRIVGVYCFLASGMAVISHYFGYVLLGSVWDYVQPVLFIMAIDGMVAAVAQVASLFHRATQKHGRAMRISILILIIRFPAVLLGAWHFGVFGAAVGLMVSSVVSASVWWLSLLTLNVRAGFSQDEQ